MFVYTVAILVLCIDQLLKYLVQHSMYIDQNIPLIDHLVSITYIHNPGAAFGMLQHQTWLFILIACAVIVACILFERRTAKNKSRLLQLAIAMLVGGAIGNLVDRILYKTVIDYLNLQIFICNFADVAITFAVVLFLWDALLRDPKRQLHSEGIRSETGTKDE